MTARLLDGKAIAQALRDKIKIQVAALAAAGKRPPGLAVVIVGQDPRLPDLRAQQAPRHRRCGHESRHEGAA